ncbi:MAG: exodeoxyribonuclease large subunit [Firmicutes bacterium]|nr:exodeoxyribonuclease large subunit [Bacillota bacterium]
MNNLGCIGLLILLFFPFRLVPVLVNKYLAILYVTFTPIQLKVMGVGIAISLGIYFLRPVYYIYSGKVREKRYLEQLHRELLANDSKRQKNHYDKSRNFNPLPPIIKRIALITSENSAGHNDFKERLYCGNFTLFDTRMNENYPDAVINTIISNINLINNDSSLDVICITRGGGNQLDCIFNDLDLADAIQNSKTPVLLGVGHSTDISLCDEVSSSPIEFGQKRYFTTPTDLAYFLNEYNQSQLLSTNKKLTSLGSVNDHIRWKPIIFYAVILYVLYLIFWKHVFWI